MSLPVWGALQKAQDDSETIEEAIARLIQAHDDDANAHLDTGQSLKSHKASAIIDHLALSIVQDKIGDGEVSLEKLLAENRFIMSCFESLDGWQTGGDAIQDFSNIKLSTTAVLNNTSAMYSAPSNWTGLDWDKKFFWQSTVKISSTTAVQAYWGMGGTDYIGGFSSAGFYLDDGDLYVYHATDSGAGYVYTKQLITGITVTDWNTYRIIYNESAGELEFYVNGVLKHTFDSSLPTADSDEMAFYQIKTTETVIKILYTSDLLISIPK